MKFNALTKGKNQVTNYEGEKAYALTPMMELYTAVVTSSLSDKFYESDDARVDRIRGLISKVDVQFVAKLSIYTREKMYLRSMPLILAVELAKIHKGDDLVSNLVARVIQRADEITELLAYYQMANNRVDTKKLNALSKQIQKGLNKAFNKFDEYQFAKYNRQAEIKLKDALFLAHPKAKDEAQQILFNKIVEDKLEVPYTWEVELSALGQQKFGNEEDKKSAFKTKWEELIESGKLGYMALLRNLRNILEAEVSATHIEKIAKRLGAEKEVQKSKQLPFRFLAAYRELKSVTSFYSKTTIEALETAISASASNIKGFEEETKVLIACDVSGSMQKPISAKSSIMNYDIGLILAMLMQSKLKLAITGMFGDNWKVVNVPGNNILSNVDEFYKREGEVGYSTNGYLVIKDLLDRKLIVDKVMIFTDCQMWNSNNDGKTISAMWNKYKDLAPNAKLYLFDLAGYGKTPLDIQQGDVYLISGWSDKIFDVLACIENGEDSLSEIEKMEI